jgi:mannosyl-oligosaccharide glucosidase
LNTQYTTHGPHFETFKRRTGKTQFLGIPVPSGEVWRAKDMVYQHIGPRAQSIVEAYKDNPHGPPDPAFSEGLANKIEDNSNFYAVQKMLDGPFSIDIVYEAENAHQPIDSKPPKIARSSKFPL